uniref:Uncharacterized protein n=1 Tax=Romanomermis culicivorax TaxID=13658 RepID=A0A915I821_ROMCU
MDFICQPLRHSTWYSLCLATYVSIMCDQYLSNKQEHLLVNLIHSLTCPKDCMLIKVTHPKVGDFDQDANLKKLCIAIEK